MERFRGDIQSRDDKGGFRDQTSARALRFRYGGAAGRVATAEILFERPPYGASDST